MVSLWLSENTKYSSYPISLSSFLIQSKLFKIVQRFSVAIKEGTTVFGIWVRFKGYKIEDYLLSKRRPDDEDKTDENILRQ